MEKEIAILTRLKYKSKNQLKNQKYFKYLNIILKSSKRVLQGDNSMIDYTKNNILIMTELLDLQIKSTYFISLSFTLIGCLAKIFDLLERIPFTIHTDDRSLI